VALRLFAKARRRYRFRSPDGRLKSCQILMLLSLDKSNLFRVFVNYVDLGGMIGSDKTDRAIRMDGLLHAYRPKDAVDDKAAIVRINEIDRSPMGGMEDSVGFPVARIVVVSPGSYDWRQAGVGLDVRTVNPAE